MLSLLLRRFLDGNVPVRTTSFVLRSQPCQAMNTADLELTCPEVQSRMNLPLSVMSLDPSALIIVSGTKLAP